MANLNEDQIAFWNGEPGEAWARHAVTADAMFADITNALLAAAAPGSGDRVLDLGCGSGGMTLEIAGRVGPIGSVTGIDISAPMIEVARTRLAAAPAANAGFVMADAVTYPFEAGSFDVLVSRLGAMFFDDPVAAFSALKAALAGDGRLALGVWRGPRENLWAMVPVSAAKPFLDMPPRPGPEEPGPFSFADPERVQAVLAAAGFGDITLEPLDFAIPVGDSVEEALDFTLEMGPLAEPFRKVDGENRTRALDAVRTALSENVDDKGTVRLAGACWIVTARAS